jgi:hypothetical protein
VPSQLVCRNWRREMHHYKVAKPSIKCKNYNL